MAHKGAKMSLEEQLQSTKLKESSLIDQFWKLHEQIKKTQEERHELINKLTVKKSDLTFIQIMDFKRGMSVIADLVKLSTVGTFTMVLVDKLNPEINPYKDETDEEKNRRDHPSLNPPLYHFEQEIQYRHFKDYTMVYGNMHSLCIDITLQTTHPAILSLAHSMINQKQEGMSWSWEPSDEGKGFCIENTVSEKEFNELRYVYEQGQEFKSELFNKVTYTW